MGTMVGVMVGYVMGTRAGERGLEELRDAWNSLRSSEEVRTLAAGGVSIAGSLFQRGCSLLADRLQVTDGSVKLRRAA
jgi:hypothetical protein